MSLLDTASLIVTPNAYKEGKLYSVVPSDGSGDLSVTRATTATRVNSAGLVELVPYNIYEYSEQFDNGYWNKLGSTIGANSVVAPNGTTTADKVIETSTTADHYVTRASNFTQGLTYTISVYAKAGERNWLAIGFNNEAQRLAWFNLSTGVVGTVLSSVTATSIESVGNGWYRCSATMTAATNLPYPSIMIAPSNGVKNYLGNGTNGLFIWGAQFVEGASALSYQRTETRLNIPRLDYSLGSCPSLLVEPQRTNLALRSEEFDNATWQKAGGTTITANSVTAPNGTLTADTFNASQTNLLWQNLSASNNTTYTLSLWVKLGTATNLCLIANNTLAWNTIGGQSFNASNGLNTSTWTRISFTFTTPVLAVGAINIHFGGNAQTGLTQSTGTVFIWGAQLEAGAYPTSYIPTTSASVTRNADVISKTGISSLIGQTEGTLFFDGVINGCQNASANILNSERNTTASFYISYVKASSQIRAALYSSSAETSAIQGGSVAIGGRFKVAYAYKSGTTTLYINGVQIGTSTTTFTLPSTLDDIYIGDQTTYFSFGESIRNNATSIWKTRLTNAELAQLTTI